MASITIDSAFIEAWTKNEDQHPAWGMNTAEPHSRKNEDGKYETVGRTFRTVKVSRASGIDLTQFSKGQRVKVTGKEVTETREHEGKKYYDLIVWADSVTLAEGSQGGPQSAPVAPQQPSVPTQDSWNAPGSYGDDTPF